MTRSLIYFIDGIIISPVLFYISSKVINEKLKYKTKKFFVAVFIDSIVMLIMYNTIFSSIRGVINYTALVLLNKYLFDIKLSKSMLVSFVVFLITLFSETIYAFFLVLLTDINVEQIRADYFADILSNIIISAIMVAIISNKLLLSIIRKLLKDIKISIKSIVIMIGLASFIMTILLYYIYYELHVTMAIVLTMVLVSVFTFFVALIFKEKNDNIKLQIEYESLTENLKDYEKMLDIQRLNNHENKNHLVAIKGLISDKNNAVKNYIDSILESKLADDNDLLLMVKRIPSGGLQGLIYQKLLSIKEINIKFKLEVSPKINSKVLKNINAKTNQQLCTVIGIYLDNAIEAASLSKDKEISISIYLNDKKLYITISNTFNGMIDIEKIYQKGYSTKGENRGYGLSLVQKIINSNELIEKETQFVGKLFKQITKINL